MHGECRVNKQEVQRPAECALYVWRCCPVELYQPVASRLADPMIEGKADTGGGAVPTHSDASSGDEGVRHFVDRENGGELAIWIATNGQSQSHLGVIEIEIALPWPVHDGRRGRRCPATICAAARVFRRPEVHKYDSHRNHHNRHAAQGK